MTDDLMEERRDLEAFANAAGQPNQPPRGNALSQVTTGIPETIIGAQAVAVRRDLQHVMMQLKAHAAAAGPDWFYRFPVKKKEGGVDWIEGPSIKLANEVHRIYGNLQLQIREIDVGDAWIFYARETDIEGGSSMERAYRQRKSQTSIRSRDAERQTDIAYQIGQSKAIRNVITNFLQTPCDYAFEEARNSLVLKIGKDLPAWRERTIQAVRNMNIDIRRVERVVGRPARDWLAPDIGTIVSLMHSVRDGMASADEVFPPIEQEAREEGGEQAPATDASVSALPEQNSEGSAATDPEMKAWQLGRDAKAKGHARRAVPGEYRDPSRGREAIAWTRGYDSIEPPAKEEKP